MPTRTTTRTTTTKKKAPVNVARLAELGDAADATLFEKPDEAVYRQILDEASRDGSQESARLVGKATLSLLLCKVSSGDAEEAHAIWTAAPDTALGRGIAEIEGRAPSTRDANVYLCAAAYLHGLDPGDPDRAALAVSSYMDRAFQYFVREEPAFVPQLLSNWWQHLEQIFGVPKRVGRVILANAGLEHIPARWCVHPRARQEQAGVDVPIVRYRYPRPGPWMR
jgi:hypothetical protein